jgi:subfamily B ATP-binding cassette protein MsbA
MRRVFLAFLSLALVLSGQLPATAVAAVVLRAPVKVRLAPGAVAAGAGHMQLSLSPLTANINLTPSLTSTLPQLPATQIPKLSQAPLSVAAPQISQSAVAPAARLTHPQAATAEAAPRGFKALLKQSAQLRLAPGAAAKMSGSQAHGAGAAIMSKVLGFNTHRGQDPLGVLAHHDNDLLSNDIMPTLEPADDKPAQLNTFGANGKGGAPAPPGSGNYDPEDFGQVNALGQFTTALIQGAMAVGSYFAAGSYMGMAGWLGHLAWPMYGVAGLLGISAAGFVALGTRILLSRASAEESGTHTPLTEPFKFYSFKEIGRLLKSPLAEGPFFYIPDHAARPLRFHTRLRKKVSWFGAYALQGVSHFRPVIVEAVHALKGLLSIGSLVKDMYRGNPEARELVKTHRKGMFTLQGINVMQAVIGVGTSYIVGSLIDAATAKTTSYAVMLAIGVGALSLFNAYLQTVYTWVKARVRNTVIRDFRVKLFGHVVKLPFSFFDREKPSEVAVRLSVDVAQVAVKNVDIPAVLPYYAAMASVAGVMMWLTSWQVTVLVTLTIPLLGVLSAIYGNKVAKLNEAQMTRQARMISTAEESLSNVRDVRGFTAEDLEQDRYAEQTSLFTGTVLKKARLADLYTQTVGQLYNFSFYLAVLFIGLFSFIATGSPTIGETMAMVGYAGYMKLAMSGFLTLYTQYRETDGSTRRVFDYLKEDPAVEDKADSVYPGRLAGNLEFKDVAYAHSGQNNGVRNVSFTAAAGERVAIVGKPGAGKSILLDLLMRLQDPNNGSVHFDGADARTLKIKGLRSQIALLHDQGIWLDDDSLRQNLTYGLKKGVSDAQIAAALNEVGAGWVLDERRLPQGLDTVLGRGDWRMSDGRRRHLELARALLADPRVLLLDRPAAGLSDFESRRYTVSLLKLMEGRTVFSIPQSIGGAQLADKILVMDKGEIVERGTHDELMALEGLYFEMSGAQ